MCYIIIVVSHIKNYVCLRGGFHVCGEPQLIIVWFQIKLSLVKRVPHKFKLKTQLIAQRCIHAFFCWGS